MWQKLPREGGLFSWSHVETSVCQRGCSRWGVAQNQALNLCASSCSILICDARSPQHPCILCLVPNGLSAPDYLFWLGSRHLSNENWLLQYISLRYPVWSWMCGFFLCTQCIVFGFLAQGPLVCLNLLNSSTSTCVKPSLCAPSVNADTPEDASPEDNNRGEMPLPQSSTQSSHLSTVCQPSASSELRKLHVGKVSDSFWSPVPALLLGR